MRTSLSLLTITLAAMSLLTPPAAHARNVVAYHVTDLGTLGGRWCEAYALNDLGQVVGVSPTAAGTVLAFRTAPNQPINPATDSLGSLGGVYSCAYAINNLGQVAGAAALESGDIHAFRTGPNLPINPLTDDLGVMGPTHYSFAYGINDRGEVVGRSTADHDEGLSLAFRTAPNASINPVTDNLGNLGGQDTWAYAINNQSQTTGYSRLNQSSTVRAFTLPPGRALRPEDALASPSAPDWHTSIGSAINDRGQVAGWLYGDGDYAVRTGTNSTLERLPDDLGQYARSMARGINDAGWVVGDGYIPRTGDPEAHAFVFDGQQIIDLTKVIDPASDYYLQTAYDINNLGQIVVTGYLKSEIAHGLLNSRTFLLTPTFEQRDGALYAMLKVPEPHSILLLPIIALPLLPRRPRHQ